MVRCVHAYIEKRRRRGKDAWSYRVRLRLGEHEGGPTTVPIGTFHKLRGEGGAEEARHNAVDDWSAKLGRPSGDLTIRQIGPRWLADVASVGVQDTTLAGYERILTDHVYLDLGEVALRDFTVERAATWQADQLRNGRVGGGPCAPKSVRNYRGVFHQVLDFAVTVGAIAENPFAKLDPPALASRTVTPPDIATMQRYVDEVRSTRYWRPVFLGSTTGMRRGELCGLRYADVDEKAGVAHIRRQKVQIGNEVRIHDHTKTPAGVRSVPLPPFVMDVIKQWRREDVAECLKRGVRFSDAVYVCGEFKPDRLTHGLRQLYTKRGLKPVNLHLLRHAVATDLIRRGVDPRVVQQLLGHKHVATTLATYDHPDDTDVKAAMEGYARAWEEADRRRGRGRRSQNAPKRGALVQMRGRSSVKRPANNDHDSEGA